MNTNSLSTKWKSLPVFKKILTIAVPAVVVIAAVVVIIMLNSGVRATTMRLLRMEGIVTLEDINGNEKSIVDNMRFSSGDALSTGEASLASIALDDHKIVTLEENSRAQFIRDGGMLELNLTDGGVFFEVNKPLEEDESFDIRTSTMTVGIRGTSGYVHVDEDGIASLILTSGHVHITGINPTTGETKELDVEPGDRVQVYLFNDRAVGSVDFQIDDISEEELNQFIIDYLCENNELRVTVCAASGWEEDIILELGNGSVTVTEETEETSETSEETDPTDDNDPTPTPEATPTVSPTSTPRPDGNGNGNGNGNTPTNTPTPAPTGTPTVTPAPTPSPIPTTVPEPAETQSTSGSSDASGSSEPVSVSDETGETERPQTVTDDDNVTYHYDPEFGCYVNDDETVGYDPETGDHFVPYEVRVIVTIPEEPDVIQVIVTVPEETGD